MMFDLTGKVSIITGGNGGLGLSMARGLVKCGGAVAVWGRNEAKNAVATEELQTLGGGCYFIRMRRHGRGANRAGLRGHARTVRTCRRVFR